jgi:hypothetical protein
MAADASVQFPLTLRGRTFSAEDLDLIRSVVSSSFHEGRSALSVRICRAPGWNQENGLPKARSCRDVLLRLEKAGLVNLPPRKTEPRVRRRISLTHRTEPGLPFLFGPNDVTLDSFVQVTTTRDSKLWQEDVERYHYLGYSVPVGPNIRSFVLALRELVACLAFSGAAWKVAPRDQWIGWTHTQRVTKLRFVVNNTRFLVFPWICVKNLALRILGLAVLRLPEDWHERHGYRLVLMETFIHADRHTGSCYKAANWLYLGETKGRRKLDRYGLAPLTRKAMCLYRLAQAVTDKLQK